MTHPHRIAHAGICILQSYHLSISCKPLMVDQAALIDLCMLDFLVKELTLLHNVAYFPLVNLVFKGPYCVAVLQMGSYKSGIQTFKRNCIKLFISNLVFYMLLKWLFLHGP